MQTCPDPEIVVREPLAPLVIDAIGAFQEPHFGDLPVQSAEHGFGGRAYLGTGESLHFTDNVPGTRYDELNREHWQARGFTDAEIGTGVSTLTRWAADCSKVTGRLLIAGLLDQQPSIRVLREQEDGQFADSDLAAEEKATLVRLAFLSQLVGYVSDRHANKTPYEAVNAFIDELEAESKLDGNRLRSMFLARTFPGKTPQHLTTPTIVEGLTRFHDLVGQYRWRVGRFVDNPDYADKEPYGALKLVRESEYFVRVLASLGYDTVELTDSGREPVSPLAIEPTE